MRKNNFNDTVEKYGKNSTEAKIAQAKLFVAQLDYDATPEGLEHLNERLNISGSEEEKAYFQERINTATLTREMQTNAINEIRNNRLDDFASTFQTVTDFFDKEEIKSIIESSREFQEEQELSARSNKDTPEELTERYQTLISKLEAHNNQAYNKEIPEAIQNSINHLRSMETPDKVNLKAYEKVPQMLNESKKHLQNQITNIAVLQNTSPKIVQTYYDAYRKQYQDNYANLESVNQPNPPENWVKGEFKNAGYTKIPNSRFAPHDKASMYAVFRLTADDNSIPDYMKQSRQYATLRQNDEAVEVTSYNSSGKTLKQITMDKTSLQHKVQISHELEGKVLLMNGSTDSINSFSKMNSKEFLAKHFDLPSYSSEYMSAAMKTKVPLSEADAFFAARKKVKQTWKAKPARANAPIINTNALSKNRWV